VFDESIKIVLSKHPEYCSQLMNPSLRNFYTRTAPVWEHRAKVKCEGGLPGTQWIYPEVDEFSDSDSITESPETPDHLCPICNLRSEDCECSD